jgi:hypothetical protein
MGIKLLTLFALSISWCRADADQIKQFLESALNDRPSTYDQMRPALDGIKDLPAQDVQSVLPLAAQCLQSSDVNARRDGLFVFQAVGLRSDSGDLLERYVEDLAAALNNHTNSIIGLLSALCRIGRGDPAERIVSPKAFAIVSTYLDGRTDSSWAGSTAYVLLHSAPSDPAMVHKVLKFAGQRSDSYVTGSVLSGLALANTRNLETLDFIGKHLDNRNPAVREEAIRVVSLLHPRDFRGKFAAKYAAQIERLATDLEIDPEFQKMAAEALLSSTEMAR